MNLNADTVGFDFGDMVYMKIDEGGEGVGLGQVIGFLFKPGSVMVQVQWGHRDMNFHYQFELQKEKPEASIV